MLFQLISPINGEIAGKEPSWSTIRSRYWKNRATNGGTGEFSPENIERMAKGRPPIDMASGKPMELEQVIPQRTGGC